MELRSEILESELPEDIAEIRKSNSRAFHTANRLGPTKPTLEEMRGLIEQGFGGLARSRIQSWLHDNPPDLPLLELLVATGDNTVRNHQYVEWCKELLDMDPENEIGLESIVGFREQEREFREATIVANRLLEFSPIDSGLIKHKIRGALSAEEYDLALSLCEEMLAENPENEYAMRQRAIICTRMRRHDDAAFFWSVWTDSGKASAEDWFRAARAHYNAKHFSETISILERIRGGFGDDEKILDLMIRSRYSLMEWGLCYELCEDMLAINGRNASGLKYRRLTKMRQAGPKDVVTNIDEDSRTDLLADVLAFSEAKRWFEYIN